MLLSYNANAQFDKLKSKALDKATGNNTPAYVQTPEDIKRIADRRKTPAGMQDVILTAQMKEELKKVLTAGSSVSNVVGKSNLLGKNSKPDLTYTLTDFYIVDSNWTVNKNDAGAPINKQLITEALLKGSDGKCYLKQYYFTEKSQGADKYGPVMFANEKKLANPNDTGEILCENIK